MLRLLLALTLITSLHADVPAIQNAFHIGGPAVIRASAVDAAGNLYLAGNTVGLPDLPNRTVLGAAKQQHVFLIKIDPSRQSVLFTLEVGSSQVDEFSALAVDSAGTAYLAGYSSSRDFPITDNALHEIAPQGGAFLVKVDPAGTRLLYATALDSSPYTKIRALTVGPSGRIYAAGSTDGLTFPTTGGAFLPAVPPDIRRDTNTVGFITQIQGDAPQVFASTLLGGTYDQDWISGIAVAADGSIHVVGRSYSKDFPITGGFGGDSGYRDNVFRAKLDANGSQLLFSGLWAGSNPVGLAMGPHEELWILQNYNNAVLVSRWDSGQQPQAGYIVYNATASSITALQDGGVLVGGRAQWDFPTRDALFPCLANLPHDPNGSFGTGDGGPQGFLLQLDASAQVAFSTLIHNVTSLALEADGRVSVTGSDALAKFPAGPTLGTGTPNASFAFRLDLSQIPHGRIAPSCIVDGMTFGSAPLVPGSFATIFGSNLGSTGGAVYQLTDLNRVPSEVDGLRVTVKGIPAPILYVQNKQVNFIVPQGVSGSGDVCLSKGAEETCLFSYIVPVRPSVFMVGSGVWAVLNEDGTINTDQNPAARGSTISIYGAGFGGYDRTFADGELTGLPLARLTREVRANFRDPREQCTGIGGGCYLGNPMPGEVTFAGAAPLAVNGLTQINVKTPMLDAGGASKVDLLTPEALSARLTVYLK